MLENNFKRKIDESSFAAIKKDTLGGASIRQIAQKHGVSGTTVNRIRSAKDYQDYVNIVKEFNRHKKVKPVIVSFDVDSYAKMAAGKKLEYLAYFHTEISKLITSLGNSNTMRLAADHLYIASLLVKQTLEEMPSGKSSIKVNAFEENLDS